MKVKVIGKKHVSFDDESGLEQIKKPKIRVIDRWLKRSMQVY